MEFLKIIDSFTSYHLPLPRHKHIGIIKCSPQNRAVVTYGWCSEQGKESALSVGRRKVGGEKAREVYMHYTYFLSIGKHCLCKQI